MSPQNDRSASHQLWLRIARILTRRNHELDVHEVLSRPVDDCGFHVGSQLTQRLRIHVPDAGQVDTDRRGRIQLTRPLDLRGEHLCRRGVEAPGDQQVDGVSADVCPDKDRDFVRHGSALQSNRRNEFLDGAQIVRLLHRALNLYGRRTDEPLAFSMRALAEAGLTPANPEPMEAP